MIPGANVTLVNQEAGVSRHTTTNDAGEYSFPGVPPGVYTIRASVAGFKTFERKDARIGWLITAYCSPSQTPRPFPAPA